MESASSFQGGQDSMMGTDLKFLKEIQDLAKGISETSEKAIALQKLWEEESKFAGSTNSSIFLTMDWNETEGMISVVESLHNQPYFWDFLHSLPWLQASSLYKEGGIGATAQFLQTIKNSLASLEDLDAVLSNQSFYKTVKIGLNITITALRFLQDWSLEGSLYNLTFWDIVWDPRAVKEELESRFGFDDLHIEKLLNYMAELNKIPTEGTLEQFVCSVLSNVSEFKANKEDKEGGCIPAWLEAKVYLVHSVNKIKLYMQIFQQWLSSSKSQKFLFELGRSMADLVSQYPEDGEAWKIFSGINILIQHVNEKLEPNFAERHHESPDVNLYLEKLQTVIQRLPQWPVMKRLLLVDGAIRNVIIQKLYFTEEIVHNLEKMTPFIKRDGLMHLDIGALFLELKQASHYLIHSLETMCIKSTDDTEASLCSGKQLNLKAITDSYLAFLQNLTNSTFISWSRILTSVKELLKREKNIKVLEEQELVFILQLSEFIQKMLTPGSSASSSLKDFQSITEIALTNAIMWLNSSANMKADATDVHIFSELDNELLENYQLFTMLWQSEQLEVFWQVVKKVLDQHDHRMFRSPMEAIEMLQKLLSKIRISLLQENQKVLNESLQFFQKILTEWPEFTFLDIDYVNDFSEKFIRNLYEVGVLTQEHFTAALSTIHAMRNVSSVLVSNTTSVFKVQDIGKIVSDFYQNIPEVGDSNAASLIQMLFFVHQNIDQLSTQSNNSVLTFFQKISEDISSRLIQHDFQNMSEVFDFLSEAIHLLQGLTQKPLCEKLATVYNYVELRAQSLAQKGKQEIEVVYSTLGNLKTIFRETELHTTAFQYLKQLFDISAESLLNNECADWYTPSILSVRQIRDVHNSLVIPLVRVLSNTSNFKSEVNVPFAMHCTTTWLQMWTEILEEMSEILGLDLNFFSYLQNGLNHLSEGLENITHAELCNTTFTISAETTSAIHLLKIITDAYNVNEWKYFETLSGLISKLSNIINVISSIKRENLEEVFQTMENATVKLQKSLLKVNVSREFLDSWFDVFFPLSSKVEYRDTPVDFNGYSLSDILTLSAEEFGTVLTDLRETAGFLKNISQDKYLLSCVIIFQNVTKLVLEDILKEKNVSQICVLSHLNPLLTSDNIVNVVEGCNRWIHIISSLSEKYITYSHLENAKRVLFLLTFLGSINETDTSLKNTLDIVNITFNLIEPPCLLNGSVAHCADICFSILANILKVLPTFSAKDDGQTHDFIFTLLNVSRGQIQSIVKDLMRFSPYTSDSEQMYFTKLITGAIKKSREVLNLTQSLQPSSVALLRGIHFFLKNITSESLQNSSSPLDTVNLLNAFEALPQDKNMSFLKKSFQHLISYFMSHLPHNMQSLQNLTLNTWMKAADLNVELVRKALNILKSYNLTNFLIRSGDKGFPKHMATLVKNTENEDLEFLIDQLKQIRKSLHYFFKKIKTVYIENSVLDKLTGWLDSFENNSCSWNLTNLWQMTQLFKETELDDILQVLYLLPDAISLIQRLDHKNITDTLIEVYTFTLTQEANMSICTKEDLSNKIDRLLELLEVAADMPQESARALSCLTAVICWNLTTESPQNDPALRTCNLNAHRNFSSIYNTIADVLEQFKLTTPGGHALCSNEDYRREITYKATCFFHQLKEWNSILLKLSEIHNINSLALKQLLGFWNKLSVYVMAFGNSSTIAVYCSSTPKRQAALELIEALNNMTSTEMAMAKAIFEQLADLYHALNLDRSTGMSITKTLLIHLKSMANEISGALNNEDVLSYFFSAAQPLLTLSPFGNQTYMVLTALSALSRNNSLIGNFEALWLDRERGIQDLLVNFSVPNLLSVIDKEIQLLSAAARKKCSLALASLLKQFNSSSLETLLRSFEDFQEVARDWLHEYTNKNFSKIINALVVLMANEKSSDDIVLIIKGITEFLELFRNGSKEDHIDISFVTDLLSGEKLNNVHVAHTILQNSLLNMISDLTTEEEVLNLNDTDLQIMDFIDLFFDDAQYENNGKQIASFQNRTMEMIKEFLQIIFPSSGGHYSNKMFVLLKNLHKDIIAEMRIFPKDDIGTPLNLDQSVNLKEEVDGLKENMYDLIKDATISENGTFHFESAKGLKFMRDLFNVLFKDFSVKNGSRSNYELFTFVNQVLFNTSNPGDFAQLIRDLSRTLQFMRQTSAEMGNLMNFFNKHFKDFLVSYPTFREMVLANLTELLASVDKVFPLKNRQIIETTETLLDLILWSGGANYTRNPFPELAVDLGSLLWESNEFVKLAKIVEVIVKFLTLSKKASEKVASCLELSINSNATENLDYIEMVYSDLQRAVHDAIEELTETETAELLLSSHHQVADLGKAFLDLTYLSIRDKLSRSYGSGTANISTRLVANLSKLSGLNDIAGEIAEFLANGQNYSAELERLVAIVTRASINSSDDTASLIEDLLDFFVPINDISKIHLTSRLNFTHDPINEEKWERIQEMITYLGKGNITSIKASIRAVADLFLGAFWKNHLGERDLNLLLTYADNQDDFLKVLEVTMESFKLMKNVSGGSFNLWSLFASLMNQNITYQQKEPCIWETIIEDSLNRTNPWIELLHLSADQQVNSPRALLQTVMAFFANGTSDVADMAQLENSILRMMHDFDLIFKPLSSYEKYARQLVNLAEYWRQGPLKEQRVSEMCQGFQKHLSPANAQLLQKVQIMALSVFTILSDNPTVISNLLCAFTSCKDDLTRCFLLSAIEGINLVHEQYQDIETMLSAANEGECGNRLYVNRKLSSTLESFQRALQNTTYSSCECQLTFENIQKHMQTALAVALAGRCDEEILSLLLTLPENGNISLAVKELCSLPALELYTMIAVIAQNLNLRYIIYKIMMPSEVNKLLNAMLEVVTSIISLSNKGQHVLENLPMFLQAFKSIDLLDISAFQQFLQGGKSRSSIVGSLQALIRAVCKAESSFFSNTNMFIDMPRITELLEDDMAKYSIPEDSTPFCLQLYQEILQLPNGALVWTFLKPLLHGKILYTPNSKTFNMVIEKANHTFGFVDNLKIYSEAWLRMSEVFKSSENFLMVNQLQEALQNSFIKNFIESHLNIDVGNLIGKLQEYESMMEKMLHNSVTEQINLLAELMVNISSCVLLDRFQHLESVEKLEAKAQELMQQNNFLASIIFNTSSNRRRRQDSAGHLSQQISYTIRTSILYSMRTDLIKNPVWKSHPQNLPGDGFRYNYIFVPLQDMIEKAIIAVHAGADASEAEIQVQAMPYPCHTSDLFLNNIGFFFPFIMMLAWMVSVAGMVRKRVYEREIHLEEYMKTMGVNPAIHFLAWFLENVIVLTISSCALVIILKVSGIIVYSDGFLVFLFILDFGVAVVMLSYLLGAFFSSANTAALCASLIYVISFLPYIVLLVLENQLSFALQIITCFLSTTAFGQGIFFITFFESQEIGSLPPDERRMSEGGSPIGVILMSLTKKYTDNKKTAVKDLSLIFYKDQITALLGANGAGKTTIISMLTGLYPPSSGTIIINGRDIHTELAAIRMEMGVCPQYDVLFDTLTVREHLLFYGSVKAPLWTKKQLHQQVSCTLIFTTHHLDEAEVLSDRIAILQQGQLRCCGPPSYLKETYGQGYRLTLIKKPSSFEIEDPEYISQVTSLVQFYVPEAFLKENSGSELTYVIPTKADKAFFNGLFQAMDENLERLHVTGYGISDTTLEEVFLKLLQYTEQKPQVPLAEELGLPHINSPESTYQNCSSLLDARSVRGTRLVLTQIAALLMKRFHHTRRDWRGALSNVLLPVLFVAMAMALFTVKPLAIDYPSLKLMPGLYDNAESSFFSTESDDLGNLSYVLLRHFAGQDHPCTYSRQDVRKNDSCWQTEPSPPQEFLDACGCVTDHRKCPSFNVSAAYLENRKGHVLYNLSGFSVEEYLIMSTNKARYGGWSFGVKTSPELQDQKLNKTYSKPLAKVWYSQKGFHSLPSYLNQLNNLILWMNLPPSVDWRQYGITLYSHPYGGALLDEDKIMENVRQCGVALCIMLGFSILMASIGNSVVKDRVSGTKRLQHISGLGYKTYWLANFLYDMLFYLVPVGLCISVIAAFQLSAFTFRENLAATALLLILFGYATLPWMYLMSRFFSSSDIAFISYISLNFVFGLCTMLLTLLPHLLATISEAQSLQNIYNILKWAFIVFPPFCLGQGLLELSYNQIKFDLTSSVGIDSYVSPFEMNFLGWIFVEMALQGTVILLLRILLHWDLLQKLRSHCSISSTVSPSEDEDVQVERKRLFGGRTQNDILLLYNLRKCYRGFSKRNTAVKDISLGIPRGESGSACFPDVARRTSSEFWVVVVRQCFGLLGTNGAGKSTTFKMLTGDITPSGGRAVMMTPTGSEMDILSASSEGILIGYCPQQDALDDLLTGWEHLYYYCSLRGVPKQCIHKVAGDLVSRLHLDTHINKLVRTYSGGTKRKLSTALALIGKPQILLLDEPSSGMDPCSKRYLWKAIMKEVQDGCAAVLTSHSMEECEALCTRLAIMVDGSFRCLGSPQHIKNRFGDGYSVKVWLNKETSNHGAILDYLQLHFPGTQFKEQHLNLQEYRVPYGCGCLPELFKVLENHKVLLQIKHYSINETTLEQVFINFATQQQETSYSAQESSTNHHHYLPV
ncbi:unnamed protein product [Caretta caretta]